MARKPKSVRRDQPEQRGFAMGSEIELGISGRFRSSRLDPDSLFQRLLSALQQQIPCMTDGNGTGVYTAQGSRVYLDQGGHPEWCSPEVRSPTELVNYELASERLLIAARERILHHSPPMQLTLFKSNLCPVNPEHVTFGCHEAYTCWKSHHELPGIGEQLIPHIVSRIAYAGSGRLSPHPQGIGFEISQRARHLVQVMGSETTHSRAIFSTRVKNSDVSESGFIRLHLIAKDATRFPLGTYLTCGTTGLLVLLINAGYRVGRGLTLRTPVESLHRLSLDPMLRQKLPLADGRQLTAFEIQEEYLATCERALQQGGFPDWADQVVHVWRETLETLARDPLQMHDRLDAYCKLRIFEHLLGQAGTSWIQLRDALADLQGLRHRFPTPVIEALLDESAEGLDDELRSQLDEAGQLVKEDARRDRLRLAVRLQRLEFSYHELGGFYDQYVDQGDSQLQGVTPQAVTRAMREPPPDCRAAARGQFIAEHARDEKWSCNWQWIMDHETGKTLDLGDPFQQRRLDAVRAPDAGQNAAPDPGSRPDPSPRTRPRRTRLRDFLF